MVVQMRPRRTAVRLEVNLMMILESGKRRL